MKLFIIAGETSGDQLGANILQSLKTIDFNLNIRGIGGEELRKAGLSESLFPMHDLSIMGVAEIVPHIPKLLRRIDQAVAAISVFNPDIILTIDSPDFCFRVLERLNTKKIRAKKIHVVAPSVWAWRPERAKKIAKFLDGLLCLLPFEPPFFEREGLKTEFMGHPVMQSKALEANGNAFRFRHLIGLDTPLCGLYFGSRKGELDRHQDLFLDIAEQLQQKISDIQFVVPTLAHFESRLTDAFRARGIKSLITSDSNEKFEAMKSLNMALHVSGTIGLELAAANIPHSMAYKFHPVSYAIGRMMVKTKYGHLANIILNDEIIPEFLQNNTDVNEMANALCQLYTSPDIRQKQLDSFEKIRQSLTPNGQKNSAMVAAEFIQSFV
jgi:lipid-A-disaccharide synthase